MNESTAAETFDESTAEHILLGDDYAERADATRTVCDRAMVRDKLRGRSTYLTFFRQGFLEIVEKRGGRNSRCVPIDLRYLDPAPSLALRVPHRLVKISAGLASIAAIVTVLAFAGVAPGITTPAAAAAIAASVMALLGCVLLTHEEIRFVTQHGRAQTLRICAGLGYIRQYRKILPRIITAIESAADEIGEDTLLYLRSEMREHYRLRGAGVLSEEQCSDSTARILAQFEEPQ